MKKCLLVMLFFSPFLMASDVFTIGDGIDAPSAPNCFAVAMFEEKLETDQAIKLCANNDPAPVFCYRFAKRMQNLGKEGAIEVCSKTPSMMKSIDCLTDNAELSGEELIGLCRAQ